MKMNEKSKAKIIDRCWSAYKSGELSREECLRLYPDLNDELLDLFKLEGVLKKKVQLDFDHTQKRIIKSRILSQLPDRDQIVTKQTDLRYKLQTTKQRFAMTWVFIVTTVLSILTGTGVVYASGDSLPGDVLYPVKQLKEDVQLLLASDEEDAELYIEFTEIRVQEMKSLMEQGRTEDLDEAVEEYQNQTKAIQQLMANVNADNPDEAIRLRTELELKLQEQAHQMQEMLDEESNANGDQVCDQLRIMLETNTQTRLRINQELEDEDPDADTVMDEGDVIAEESGEGSTEEPLEETEDTSGNGMQVKNAEFINASGDEQQATFRFRISNAAQCGVYAEVDGSLYTCSVDGEEVSCDIPDAEDAGTINLYCQADNSLLYSYNYDHDWLGTKDSGGGSGQNQGGTGSGDHDNGQTGKNK